MCCDTLYFYVRKTRSNFEFRYVFQFTNKRINILNQIVKKDFIFNSLFLQETSFASNQPVTRSLSSVTNNNKSKLPLPKSVMSNGGSNSNGTTHSVNNQNRINTKKTDLEKISPWLVSSDAIHTKKEKEKTKIPQLKTVITTEL